MSCVKVAKAGRHVAVAMLVCILSLCGCSLDFSTSGGTDGSNPCGNGDIDIEEECDSDNLAGRTCETSGFVTGSLSCRNDCTLDLTGCEIGCGNGVLDTGEECDDGPANSNILPDTCRRDCRLPNCGDNVSDTSEACDGPDLKGASCESLALGLGSLECLPDCTGYDIRDCSGAEWCGNILVETGEVCDASNLAGQTCETLGYMGGVLSCEPDCSDFDVKQCIRPDGGPCTSQAQCDSGHCSTEAEWGWPGGFCVDTCTTSADCTPGSECDQISSICVQTCVISSECREGYGCFAFAFGQTPYCYAHCEEDAHCTETLQCNQWTGKCAEVPLGSNNGQPCNQFSDCKSGGCVGSASGPDYCVSDCSLSTGFCPDNGVCVDFYPLAGDRGLCLTGCTTSADCLLGVQCSQTGTELVCW